jgi:hypothetical protein
VIFVHPLQNGVIDVRVTKNMNGMHADGRRRYLPSYHLFGMTASDVPPGVYETTARSSGVVTASSAGCRFAGNANCSRSRGLASIGRRRPPTTTILH